MSEIFVARSLTDAWIAEELEEQERHPGNAQGQTNLCTVPAEAVVSDRCLRKEREDLSPILRVEEEMLQQCNESDDERK